MLDMMNGEQSPYREIAGQKAFQELVQLIGFCVSSDPSLRPGSVGAILDVLEKIQNFYPWQQASAESWWIEHDNNLLQFTFNIREGKPASIPSNQAEDHLEKV